MGAGHNGIAKGLMGLVNPGRFHFFKPKAGWSSANEQALDFTGNVTAIFMISMGYLFGIKAVTK